MIYYVLQFAEEFLSTKNIALDVSVPDDITATFVPSKIRHQIFLVIKEGMNNIVKHSKATKVDITISTDKTMIRIKVSDNGVGMIRNEQDQFQYGIASMKKRIEALKGIFTIVSREHAGTDLLISVDLSAAV
ncbi:MAG: hypothetical protein HY966_08240 [Ignavibacteriales bacterium]|nr:hypothetical protein [Ignavibacteriales bacterium]